MSELPVGLTGIVNSSALNQLLTNMATNISTTKVANLLAIGAGIAIGLVFLWWGVRKVTSMLMAAFRNGKMSI